MNKQTEINLVETVRQNFAAMDAARTEAQSASLLEYRTFLEKVGCPLRRIFSHSGYDGSI